jgi:hypothetical protein
MWQEAISVTKSQYSSASLFSIDALSEELLTDLI